MSFVSNNLRNYVWKRNIKLKDILLAFFFSFPPHLELPVEIILSHILFQGQEWTPMILLKGCSRRTERYVALKHYHSTDRHCPALLSRLPHSNRLSGWHHCEVWDLGHSRSGALPQPRSNVLQRSSGGHRGLWHHQHGRFLQSFTCW